MMVDAAMQCAQGSLSIEQLQEQLDGKYKHTSKLAPSEGLYLAQIQYKGDTV